MSKGIFSVLAVTAYLVLYVCLIHSNSLFTVSFYMLTASPVLIIWMVMAVLRDDCEYRELEEGEEWGYRDITDKSFPGM